MFDQLPLMGEGRSAYEKDRSLVEYKKAEVLITVKAAPQPSATYGDTVCVAGIRMGEEGPEWVRLYPIPFRSMDDLNKFKKYDLVEVPIKTNAKDFRSESFKPLRDQLKTVAHLEKWKQRHPYISPLTDKWTMCEILAALSAGEMYPSLAVVRPKRILELEINPFEGWTRDQQLNIERAFNQGDLFEDRSRHIPLQAPRFRAHFRYECETPGCNSHRQTLADWEFEVLSRRHAGDPEAVAIAALQKRFVDERSNPKHEPLFFVGNLQRATKAYNVLGIYRTKD